MDEAEKFSYSSEASNPAFLGKLEGPCADIINPTRNGRKYSEELWEKVFEDPIVNELLDNGGIIGEGMHPMDGREEVDIEKAAIVMKEKPIKRNGKLWATFHILNTPVGRIIKNLCDAGFNIGVSSRGSGDVSTDYDGSESVDPDSYRFTCFDAVFVPAVKEARMKYVSESLTVNKHKKLIESLTKELEKANDKDKKIMLETLEEYNIDIPSEKEFNIETSDEKVAVDNILADDKTLEMLLESVKQNKELEKKIITLNEKLSVSYAEEASLKEALEKYKLSIVKLSQKSNQVAGLQEKVNKLTEQLESQTKLLESSTNQVRTLSERVKDNSSKRNSLNEELSTKDREIKNLNEKLRIVKLNLSAIKNNSNDEITRLNESIQDLKKDLSIKKTEYSNKIETTNKLVEKYKSIATKAVDKYISSLALKLGVSVNEIKNKLPESYSFNDIDAICENLLTYSININSLPFKTTKQLKENILVGIQKSKEPILPALDSIDEIDDQLLSLAGLK